MPGFYQVTCVRTREMGWIDAYVSLYVHFQGSVSRH
jgi:hypothetical protein